MVRPCWRYLSFWGTTLVAGLDEHFPFTIGVLQGVQIEAKQIIEEVTLDLTTKNVDLRTQDV